MNEMNEWMNEMRQGKQRHSYIKNLQSSLQNFNVLDFTKPKRVQSASKCLNTTHWNQIYADPEWRYFLQRAPKGLSLHV